MIFQMVGNCCQAAGEDGQRDQERLAHAPQEAPRGAQASNPAGAQAQAAQEAAAAAAATCGDRDAGRPDRAGVFAGAVVALHVHHL
jgi:hypothetical protein